MEPLLKCQVDVSEALTEEKSAAIPSFHFKGPCTTVALVKDFYSGLRLAYKLRTRVQPKFTTPFPQQASIYLWTQEEKQ